MVYEAYARIRDPVYGCAGAVCQLTKQLDVLQAELAMTQAQLFLIIYVLYRQCNYWFIIFYIFIFYSFLSDLIGITSYLFIHFNIKFLYILIITNFLVI